MPVQADPGAKRIDRYELVSHYSHATEYLVLAIFIARALVCRGDLRFAILAVAFVVSALFALSDEIHQLFVPGRAFEWSDLALDLGGVIIGLAAYSLIIILWRRRIR